MAIYCKISYSAMVIYCKISYFTLFLCFFTTFNEVRDVIEEIK